jgi:hypothetical protein
MLTGFVTRKVGFFRTPKQARTNALWRALIEAREESLLLAALVLAATALLSLRPDADMLDVQIWATVLLVQAIPYGAALLLALISGLPRLPAGLVGPLGPLGATPQRPAT